MLVAWLAQCLGEGAAQVVAGRLAQCSGKSAALVVAVREGAALVVAALALAVVVASWRSVLVVEPSSAAKAALAASVEQVGLLVARGAGSGKGCVEVAQ